MIKIRPAEKRGLTNIGWLKSYHTFSFGDYYDPDNMGFRSLRVINEDRVKGGEGFDAHPHNNMEIISIVLAGALQHKDSMGNGSVIKRGDVQLMSAGTGVTHSEYNASKTEESHFLQIWIIPAQKGLKPGYQQKYFSEEQKANKLCLFVSSEGEAGSLLIHQDMKLFGVHLTAPNNIQYPLAVNRHVWLQMIKGNLLCNKQVLKQGDGASVSEEKALNFTTPTSAEFLLFDLNY
ncbi:MAG: quercetin 2,3-dioxygenase [Omnitrophica WOR_2 bacterium GWA2_47_8]|nr:MAG: quercetin 2,3-dioxygenase [Omnitrophica WOR_2 bacterium GWA2_47_8]